MADQLPALVKQLQAEGVPEAEILAFIDQFDQPVASHAPTEPKSSLLDTALKAAPAVGGMVGSFAGGSKLSPAGMALAGVGGAAGEAVRQVGQSLRGDFSDVPETVMGRLGKIGTEGLKQGGIEGVGRGAVTGVKTLARGVMRGAIPKGIANKFPQLDVAQEALNRNAVPGLGASARRINRQSRAANAERVAAARTVPDLTARQATSGHRALYDDAVSARMPDRARAVVDDVRGIRRELAGGLSGEGALARKEILQQEGKAAVNAPNPKTAALGPQLANTQRRAIVDQMRQTPRMATALDESQALMALDKVMQDASRVSSVGRMRQSLASGLLTPTGVSLTAHGLNKGAPVVSPQMLRAIQIAMLGQE